MVERSNRSSSAFYWIATACLVAAVVSFIVAAIKDGPSLESFTVAGIPIAGALLFYAIGRVVANADARD
jgi:hypothetical protein